MNTKQMLLAATLLSTVAGAQADTLGEICKHGMVVALPTAVGGALYYGRRDDDTKEYISKKHEIVAKFCKGLASAGVVGELLSMALLREKMLKANPLIIPGVYAASVTVAVLNNKYLASKEEKDKDISLIIDDTTSLFNTFAPIAGGMALGVNQLTNNGLSDRINALETTTARLPQNDQPLANIFATTQQLIDGLAGKADNGHTHDG